MATVRTGIYSVYIYIIMDLLTFSTATPFTLNFAQGQFVTINCSETITEELEILAIDYQTDSCQHTDTFGVANLCNGKSFCSFDVTNANIGSSCGMKETASIAVTFKCIRHGGWSKWIQSNCPVTCGGSQVNATRKCNNPTPNEYGRTCEGDAVGEIPCGTRGCFHEGYSSNCTDLDVTWKCVSGYIHVAKADWESQFGACVEVEEFYSKDVKSTMIQTCNNKTSCKFELTDSTFDVTCKECTRLSYVYQCKVAHWSEWSRWSTCTVSCGTGLRTRSRNCSGSLPIINGKGVGCEGNMEESSHCTEDRCPYCPSESVQPTSPNSTGYMDNSTGSGYILTGNIYTISCCARIHSWTFKPVNHGRITILILRMTVENRYKVVGFNSISVSVSDINQFQTYNVSANESIGIVNGDVIGWFDDRKNIIEYKECKDNEDMCPVVFRLNIESVDVETELDFQGLLIQPNRSYELYYSTSDNRIPEINTNIDDIAIADHSVIDDFISFIPIQDPDIGDFATNFVLDYANDYVYFDTKLRSLYVKDKLPHIVGQHNTSLSYRLIVVDSCNNKADLTISFISYNDPPLLTNVPSNVTIQASTAGIDKPFSQFTITDPSGDNITCTIFNNGSETDYFSLKQDGHNGITDLSLFLMENYSAVINTSTILELSCTDGTSTANTYFTINFQSENQAEIVNSKPVKTSSVISIVVPIACVLIIIVAVIVVIIFRRKHKTNDVQDIVEYTKADENMGTSREQNHYSGLGEHEMEDEQPPPIENAYNPAWR